MSKISGIVITLLFILFPFEIKTGILQGLKNTVTLLIPSIYPYMVISSFFLNTGAIDVVSKIISSPINKLTGISKNASAAYLLSLFCGYPTGARLATQLYSESSISEHEMKKLFCFASVPGFGFCVSFLGGLYKNGLKIYFSYILASLIIFFLLKEKKIVTNKITNEIPSYNFGESLIRSIKTSSLTMLELSGYICFFSGFCEIIKKIAAQKPLSSIICIFLEIATGNKEISGIFYSDIAKYIAVFMTGFGGMCVIFQSMSFSKNKISIIYFMTARLIFAILSLVIFIIMGG